MSQQLGRTKTFDYNFCVTKKKIWNIKHKEKTQTTTVNEKLKTYSTDIHKIKHRGKTY